MTVFPRKIPCTIAVLLTLAILCVVVYVEEKRATSVRHKTSKSLTSDPSVYLSPDVAAKVKKFVFFAGYPRSGHSIIGALMDAHPHIVIAHEFFLFTKFAELNRAADLMWKENLFDLLYEKSVRDAEKGRASSRKGYNLEVKGLWQGKFDRYIEVIGDKSGGRTTASYLQDKLNFIIDYRKLKKVLSMPVRIIHAVRNPFDIISTMLQYKINNASAYRTIKQTSKSTTASAPQKFHVSNETLLERIEWFFLEVEGVNEMIEEVFGRENVLEVHNCDLVGDPRGTISRIFQFLEVDISEQFLDACEAKIFKSVSRSRDTIEWSPELRKMVEELMSEYQVFYRYNFTSN